MCCIGNYIPSFPSSELGEGKYLRNYRLNMSLGLGWYEASRLGVEGLVYIVYIEQDMGGVKRWLDELW